MCSKRALRATNRVHSGSPESACRMRAIAIAQRSPMQVRYPPGTWGSLDVAIAVKDVRQDFDLAHIARHSGFGCVKAS